MTSPVAVPNKKFADGYNSVVRVQRNDEERLQQEALRYVHLSENRPEMDFENSLSGSFVFPSPNVRELRKSI